MFIDEIPVEKPGFQPKGKKSFSISNVYMLENLRDKIKCLGIEKIAESADSDKNGKIIKLKCYTQEQFYKKFKYSGKRNMTLKICLG